MSLNLSCIFEIRVWVAVLAMASISVFLGCSGVDSSTKRQLSTAQKHASPTFCDANLQTPGDISLRVSLKSGQTVFPEGEIIVLTTSYSAHTRKKYSVWGGSEVGLPFFGNGEVYCLSPDIGLTDNLLEGAIWPGIAGGGSTSLGMSDSKPVRRPRQSQAMAFSSISSWVWLCGDLKSTEHTLLTK